MAASFANRIFAVVGNLRREAAQRGVDPEPLVFAPREPMADCLAPRRRADLFLDTPPYSAVGSAYPALAAGLPAPTCAGETFASRTAGAILHAVGLPGLVTNSLAEYARLALELARSPQLLGDIRQQLGQGRSSASLFDPGRLARDLEAAFERMWQIWCADEPPRSFSREAAPPGSPAPPTALSVLA